MLMARGSVVSSLRRTSRRMGGRRRCAPFTIGSDEDREATEMKQVEERKRKAGAKDGGDGWMG